MLDLPTLAREMATQRNQPFHAWEIALTRAESLVNQEMLSEENLRRLAQTASAPSQILLFCDYASRDDPENTPPFEQLANCIDDTRYNLRDWLNAMDTFHQWILANKRSSSFRGMLGYIHCCAEMGSNQSIPPELPGLISSMLKQYGLDT